jgi:dihydroorotate dehydrogenase
MTPRIVDVIRALVGDDTPVVASGGIFTADDVRKNLEAGASAVQVYTSLIYQGPGLPGLLTRGLAEGAPARRS